MSFCVWCDKEFNKKSQKQIYCSIECRHQASKEKILERYIDIVYLTDTGITAKNKLKRRSK